MSSKWTEKETTKLRQLVERGLTNPEIARQLDRTHDAVEDKAKGMRKALRERTLAELECKAPPGETEKKVCVSELILEADNCIVANDFHVPGEDEAMVRTLIKYGVEHKVESLIINGDFWNQDAISRWQFKDPAMNLKIEIKKGIALVKRLAKHFKLYFVCGNHDSRLPKALNYALNFSDWMDALFGDSVVATNFDFMKLISGGKEFRVCHPDAYSKIKGSQVSLLAHDLQENIIMAHQHFISVSTNKTGKFICVDSGCMCDQKAFYYRQSATTRFPNWETGFVHVKNGKVHLVCDYTF